MPAIVVVGAGVIGLSTAIQLQQALPGATVTIVADSFDRDTISDGAAGIFRPTMDKSPGAPREVMKQWARETFQHFHKLVNSPEAKEAGASVISGYFFYKKSPRCKDPIYRDVVYDWRDCTKQEYEIMPGLSDAHAGVKFTTLMVEGRWYLPYLTKQFLAQGGKIEKRTIKSLGEFVGVCDLVVNCSGLASRQLAGDSTMVPIRGQMIRAKAPWLKHFLFVDDNCWVVPGIETVTIGGTRQMGDSDVTFRQEDKDAVWQRACQYVPSLKNAEIAWDWVGLRPHREPIRIEQEVMHFGEKSLKVVHNYGHGGNGVGLSWGTAKEACQLVCQALSSQAKL